MTIFEAFERFDRDNPHVFKRLVALAREAKLAGRRHLGMRLLFERVRWDMMMQIDSDDEYKINNNYAPHYARKMIRRYPEFEGFFQLRACRGEQLEIDLGRAA